MMLRPRPAAEGGEALIRESPGGRMGGDASAGFQDVAGDGEFVGGCADVAKRIMQDEIFQMDKFAIDPE